MSAKQVIYIDCQFFQTPAWDRGMGKYTHSLLNAAASELGVNSRIFLIFSKNMPADTVMLDTVKKSVPSSEIAELDLRTTEKINYQSAATHNKKILEDFIGKSSGGIDRTRKVFFIPCLFQEPTAPIFPDKTQKIMIYYDAIPLLYYQKYKGAINYSNYLQRYTTLWEADTILTISQTVADDLALYLGIRNDRIKIVNIDGAAISEDKLKPHKPEVNIPRNFILLATSDDIRKNNKAAVQALEQFRTLSKRDYKLVITSSFRKEHRTELKQISRNIIFTGNIPENELVWLYKNAATVLTTSEYEGLGLPILEALRFDVPIACSDIPVFREISTKAFYYFDPLDTEDITLKLYEAVNRKNWPEKRGLYSAIDNKYTWQRSAKLFASELYLLKDKKSVVATKKPRVAILAPSPRGYSAIGKVVQELHAVMAEHFEIDYYFESRKQQKPIDIRPNYVCCLANCYEVEEFNARIYAQYDAVIYHVGNSEYHFETIKNALYLPGIVILHETVLKEAFGEMVRLGYMSLQRLEAEQALDDMLSVTKSALISSLINNQLTVIAHSSFAQKAIKAVDIRGVDVEITNLPVVVPEQNAQSQNRELIHIGLAGVLAGRKGLEKIKQLATNQELKNRILIHVFGFNLLEPKAVKELDEYRNIRIATDLSDMEYQMRLSNLDVLVNFRSEYRGETSLTVLEAMRYGVAVIVNGELGWFSELPGDAVVKAKNEDEITELVRQLVLSSSTRKNIGNNAKNYVEAHHRPNDYAKKIASVLNQILKDEHKQDLNHQRSDMLKHAEGVIDAVAETQRIRKSNA